MGVEARAYRIVGRYAIYDPIAGGGMATVYHGRFVGPLGFTRTVAIKQLHPQYARESEFVDMFIDEARLASRIRHPNVVPTLDVVRMGDELFLVMEYVHGESLSRLVRSAVEQGRPVPPRVATSILCGVLHGLHAAHEARSDTGTPLELVHRDVSPQNVLVGADGIARVVDFGVAKALGRSHSTSDGRLKGKLPYMAPEQLEGIATRRTDVFAASVVLWETLTGARLLAGQTEAETVGNILEKVLVAPSQSMPASRDGSIAREALDRLDAVSLRGLARRPEARFESARDMALALEDCFGLASPTEVGVWVEATAPRALAERARRVAEIEGHSLEKGPDSMARPAAPSEPPNVAERRSVPTEPRGHVASVRPRPGRGLPGWAVGAGVSLVVAVAVSTAFSAWTRRRALPEPLSVAAPAPPSAHAVPPQVAVGPPASVAAASASASAPSIDPAASPEIPAADSPRASPETTKGASSVAPHGPAAAVPKPDCAIPFTVDTAGHKHFKEECFH